MIGRNFNDIEQILPKKQMNRICLKTTANFEPNTLETPISSILQTLSMKFMLLVFLKLFVSRAKGKNQKLLQS